MQASILLLKWYDKRKRDLPWRHTRDPYAIWISEIMLQQTRTETVKSYYARFLQQLPTVEALAKAPEEQVLKLWEGLGYYSRARNLQKAAQTIMERFGGVFPSSYDEILSLPGIGPYTAGAVGSIAFGLKVPAIDGNVIRVASRFFGIREDVGIPSVQRKLREEVISILPAQRCGDMNQALMELGATVCVPVSPECAACPWSMLCDAAGEGDAGSLPIHERKAPPKQIYMTVGLLTYRDRILVTCRTERMLKGLYVFFLADEENGLPEEQLAKADFAIQSAEEIGSAKHIFTHRVWNMTIMHYRLSREPSAESLSQMGASMVTADQMRSLPFPSAMRVAVEKASEILQNKGADAN